MAPVVALHAPAQRQSRPPRRRRQLLPACPRIEVKSLEGWRFQWHEEILRRSDLSRSEIAIAGVLMHAYRVDRGFAEIALTTLALRAGCSRRRAVAATKRLRSLGLIAVINEGERVRGRSTCATMATHRYHLVYLSRGVGGAVDDTTWCRG
jgi:hypothetical protein